MAAVQPIRQQSYEQIYKVLKTAILEKRCVSAYYRGYFRLLCPYILGQNSDGTLQLLAFQYGGESASGLGPARSPDNWRCVAMEKLTDVKFNEDKWLNPPNYSRAQTCVTTVEVAVDLAKKVSTQAE